jgi:hypothetical protein
MKRITGAVAAALLVTSALASPAMAQGSQSVARAGAEVEEASELRGGFIIPALAIIAIILGIIAAVGGDDDGPTSP